MHRPFMKLCRAALIFLAGMITASCSEKSGVDPNQNSPAPETKPTLEVPALNDRSSEPEAKGEEELQPAEDEIGEDCVAFLRSTKTVPVPGATADCPQCAATTEATEVLKFGDIRVDRVARSESTCEVHVTIHATFNPSPHESIAGGLTAWISPEQRAKYLQGEIPPGQQTYKVKVIYRRTGKHWRAVEFDRL
jgi:hypothetical protein